MKHTHWWERYIGFTLGINPLFAFFSLVYLTVRRTKGIWKRIITDRISLLFSGLLAVSGLISIAIAVDRTVALGSYLIPFGFMWMYVLGRWSIQEPKQFLQDFIRGVTLLALIAVIAKVFHIEWSIGEFRILDKFKWGFERGEILYVSDNSLGLLFQAGIIGAVGSLMTYWGEKKHLYENAIAFLLCSWGLIISGSRGAMMAVAVALCYLMLHFSRKAILGLVGTLGFFGLFASERFLSTFALAEHSSRLKIWFTSLRIIKDNPLFGVGPGNFGKVFDVYRPVGFTKEVACAHSNYLNIFIGWGIIGGLLFWGWQVFILLRAGLKGLRPIQRIIIAILIGFYAHVLINELFTAYAGFLLGLLDHPAFEEAPCKEHGVDLG